MQQNSIPEHKRQEIINDLLRQRSNFISIRAKLTEFIEPKVFKLELENISNVRNSIIVSGALATIGLLVLDNQTKTLSDLSGTLLRVSIIGFLLSIIFYSFYLKNSLGKGINAYLKKLEENSDTATKGELIINDCLDEKITKDEADNKLAEVYKEIEYKRIRIEPEDDESQRGKEKYLANFGNMIFISSIAILALSFFFDIIKL